MPENAPFCRSIFSILPGFAVIVGDWRMNHGRAVSKLDLRGSRALGMVVP